VEFWIEDEDGDPVPLGDRPEDCMKFMSWLRKVQPKAFPGAITRVVKQDDGDGVTVSTVFTGQPMSPSMALTLRDPNRTPCLYETLVMGGLGSDHTERYTNRRDALEGHANLCREYLGREPA
jgi:hypothetical protein